MEKANYETFEYLPSNGPENEQFFIVQNNETFMISRNGQYTTEVQDNKQVLESVQVYSVTPQPYLVDVNNSSELISVSDEFIIPEGENNLYANSYLLQPGCSTPAEPMDQDPNQNVAELQAESHIDLGVGTQTNKGTNSCTEITLTDEQYQMLEQKGYILLEISDKIYVLDTLGLHDITTNQKLIQKLKSDGQASDSSEIDSGNMKPEVAYENDDKQEAVQDSLECKIENNNVVEEEAVLETPFTDSDIKDDPAYNTVYPGTPNTITPSEINADEKSCELLQDDAKLNTRVLVIENEDICRVGNTLKVKTKLSLKDFPDEIVLGKSIRGKNLIAKVVKLANDGNNEPKNTDQDKPEDNSELNDLPALQLSNNNILSDSEFSLVMQHFFQNNMTKCTAEDVVTADSIITQLIEIPNFKSSVIDNNLVITKTVQNEDSPGKGLTTLVTGKVSFIADRWRFVHLPHMLPKMISDAEDFLSKSEKGDTLNKEDYDVLHVQISEAKHAETDDIARVSVTVNKRNIPIHLVTCKQNQQTTPVYTGSKQQGVTIYACSLCAALFETETELKTHQTDCAKKENKETKGLENSNKHSNYSIVGNGKTKYYKCLLCDVKFNRLNTCKNHLKTHFGPQKQNSKDAIESGKAENNQKGFYKCNMCSCTYFHPSTLSKHIVSRHIKMKS